MRRSIGALRAWLGGLLEAEVSQLTRPQASLAYLVRLMVETWRELQRDKCFVHASSLAYKSLLSLVPFVVIVMTVSSGPFLQRYQTPILDGIVETVYPITDEKVEQLLAQRPEAQAQSADEVKAFLQSSRDWLRDEMRTFTANAGATGGVISLVFLVLIIIFLMVDIEWSFNNIWGVRTGRPVVSKVASYTAVLFWSPVLLLMMLSVSSWARGEAAAVSELLRDSPARQWLWDACVGRCLVGFLLPAFFAWLILIFVYLYMPNTRVRRRAAATGGAIAAVMLYFGKWAFELYVVNMVSYDRIYGTLSVIPVTLIWLYTSWVIILFGAEVSFTIQNFEDLTHKAERERRGIRLRLYYAVRTVYTVCRRFMRGESPRVLDELAVEFQIAEYALRSVVRELVDHGILARVDGEADAFVPARSPETLTVRDVIDALQGRHLEAPSKDSADTMWIDADPVRDVIHELFRRYERAAEEQLGATSFADLARRVDSQAPRRGEGGPAAPGAQPPPEGAGGGE